MTITSRMTLWELQKQAASMYEARGFKAGAPTLALGIAEEAGEVARAVLINNCNDFFPSPSKLGPEWESGRDTARQVGDLITYALALCHVLGIEPTFKWMERGWSWDKVDSLKADVGVAERAMELEEK